MEYTEQEKQANVPYFVHEAQMARMERIIKRLFITIVVTVAVTLIMFIVNNVIWMKYVESEYHQGQGAGTPIEQLYEQPDTGAD